MFKDLLKPSEDLHKFLLNSIWRDYSRLNINSFREIIWADYFDGLREASSKWTDFLIIQSMIFTLNEFCSLVKAAKRAKNLVFILCGIYTDSKCEFGEMNNWKVELIDLSYCGSIHFSNWVENQDRLNNILWGINECKNLRISLKRLNISYDCPEENKITESDIKNKFEYIQDIEISL